MKVNPNSVRFGDVKPGQKIMFHPTDHRPTVYTKTEPYTMPRGMNKGRISQIQYRDDRSGRLARAFCDDPNFPVYLVENQQKEAA